MILHRAIVRRHVQATVRESDVGAGLEEQVLAVAAEGRRNGVAHAVGDLVLGAGLRVVQEDGTGSVRQALGVGDPAAVGRPRHRVGVAGASRGGCVGVAVEFHRLALCYINVIKVQIGIVVADFLAVGRPSRVEMEPVVAELDVDRILLGQLIAEHQLIAVATALRIAQVGDPLAIGRPGWRTLVRSRR